jgi:hypothetical protein
MSALGDFGKVPDVYGAFLEIPTAVTNGALHGKTVQLSYVAVLKGRIHEWTFFSRSLLHGTSSPLGGKGKYHAK